MRTYTIYLFVLLLILPSANPEQTSQDHEMIQLAKAFESNGLSVSEWNVTIKEQMKQNRAKEIIDQLSEQLDIKETNDEGSKKYRVQENVEDTDMDVQYTIVLPDDDRYKSEFIVRINGNEWNEKNKNTYIRYIEDLKDDMFTERSQTFTCLTAGIHDKLIDVNFADMLQEALEANIITKQTDSIEDSMIKKIVYGYTPLWDEEITIDDEPINFQFVIKRKANDGLSITAGTPILINEY